MNPRYSIGIDLGTTNSVVAFAPIDEAAELQVLKIPQWVGPGEIESRLSLPSFLYLPREGEVESLRNEFTPDPALGVAGVFARSQAADNPQRVVVAAKSWLCHSSAGRTEALLPWQSPPEVMKVSAYDCTARFLSHLVAAWNTQHSNDPFANQQVVLTVPASFAPAAREFTRQAAIAAGFPESFVLLEEPQAAVYRWLAANEDSWRETLHPDDVLLVVDVGGGTTDLTLVSVTQSDGELQLKRLAVGNHLLLGGDNMDLALAHFASTRFSEQGHHLDPWQNVSLWHACRDAKEQLLAPDSAQSRRESDDTNDSNGSDRQTISVLGRGSSLIGGTISTEITRTEASNLIVEGFFPLCSIGDRPEANVASGFQDIGLPYELDAAVTKHVAAFLSDQSSAESAGAITPTHLIFNGGVFRSSILRDRMRETISSWSDSAPVMLGGPEELDTSVAIGAAYYGWCKRNGGIRIRGGTARSYYVGIETAGLAIPGVPRPLRALCVAARAMEEGTQAEVPSEEVGIIVGKPARFRFFSSSVRIDDHVGQKLDRWSKDELVEIDPITVHLSSEATSGEAFVPVRFVSKVTELGMFELWCHSTRSDEKWKMEFNARDEK